VKFNINASVDAEGPLQAGEQEQEAEVITELCITCTSKSMH
jgi:hypothetical protein